MIPFEADLARALLIVDEEDPGIFNEIAINETAIRPIAAAIVRVLATDPEMVTALAIANEGADDHSHGLEQRGEIVPIEIDEIEMRWASQWNESDDGEVRAWRADVAALIDEVRRLNFVSNAYFEAMVKRSEDAQLLAARLAEKETT